MWATNTLDALVSGIPLLLRHFSDETIFDPLTGKPLKRYYREQNGIITLFPLEVQFHPEYGTELEIITPEIIQQYQQQSKKHDELIAYYKFDGNAFDSSENRFNGAEYGEISYVAGRIGQAARFNGKDSRIQIVGGVDFALPEWTLAVWINPEEFPSSPSIGCTIIGKREDAQENYNYMIALMNNGTIRSQYETCIF